MRFSRRLAAVLSVLLVSAALSLGAAPAHAASQTLTQVGSWLTPRFANFYGRNFTGGEAYSSVAVGDIDGDGQPDVVAGFPDGMIQAWHTNGQHFMYHFTGAGSVQASPLLVDLNGDGILDVLAANTAGDIVGVNSAGQRLFQSHDICPKTCGFFGTPAVADLEHNGKLDVIAGGWGERVMAWRLDGSLVPGFPVQVYDTVWSSPSVADLDGDGWPEIIVGGDSDTGSARFGGAGGVLWVIRHDGSNQPGFPKFVPGQTMWSTPAVRDINGDGSLDIVIGTGHNFPAPAGQIINAFDRYGGNLPGWPVHVSAPTMSSPAIGDINGDGKPEVVSMSDDGRIWAMNGAGQVLPGWPQCGGTGACPLPLHGSVSIADVDNDGKQEIVAGSEHWIRAFSGDGSLKWAAPTKVGVQPITGVPAVANINGKSWIIASAGLDTDSDGFPDTGSVWAFTTGADYARSDWPTFKQNFQRSGSILDRTPPTVSLVAPSAIQGTTRAPVSWSAVDGESGVANFDLDVRDGSGPWIPWIERRAASSTAGSTSSDALGLFGDPGHTYSVRARARDRAANLSGWTAAQTVTFSPTATHVSPFASAYVPSASGPISSLSSAPVQGPSYGFNIARGIAALPGGGYELDGYGGIHPFGSAPSVTGSSYWSGWDIARGIAVNTDGSGYVLDGWGGLHPFGGAVAVTPSAYWGGWDIARGIALLPSSTKTNPAGYVLDGWGGLHAFGSAPSMTGSGYWGGWDIARGLTVSADGSGYVLDGWGGLHPFGGAPAVSGSGYWGGWDIARGLASLTSATKSRPGGYVVDGYGGVHPFGSAPAVEFSRYFGVDVARGISLAG